MKNEIIRSAYDSILPDGEAKARMLRNILSALSDAQPERTTNKMRRKSIKRGTMLILAAALALALSVTALAYTTNLFGFRALQKGEPDGSIPSWGGEDATQISITQPQDIPEDIYEDIGSEIAEGIAEKLEKNRLAWEEWQNSGPGAYYKEYSELEEKYELNSWDCAAVAKHEDGSASVDYYSFEVDSGTYKFEKTVEMPVEDYKRYTEILEILELFEDTGEYESKYDFNYHVNSKAQEVKLKEIAEKYGLNLRKDLVLIGSSETSGTEGDGFYTNEELVSIISNAACSGRLFYGTPAGFDKVYYYDEGTFGVSWYADMPSSDAKAYCYGYNSVYSTLSSGNEIESYVEDIDSFTSRKHTCPDGTEVTILSGGGSEAFIYVYLEDSFFVVDISGESIQMDNVNVYNGSFTDADIDYIADSINYSVIGK